MTNLKKSLFVIVFLSLPVFLTGCVVRDNFVLVGALAKESIDSKDIPEGYWYVTRVVDGDTIDVKGGGRVERVRMIGINTPESVDPRRPVECFGKEASVKGQEMLANQIVKLESDPSQTDRDKYGRILRYVTTKAGLFYNQEIVKLGYGREYTYKVPYKFQKQFKSAQAEAQKNKRGLWADGACTANKKNQIATTTKQLVIKNSGVCQIKGNISRAGQKIYHLPSCDDYKATIINPIQGEKFFCTEVEAQKAGFRRALNCK